MARVNKNDVLSELIMKMSGGAIGCIPVISRILAQVDGFAVLKTLDTNGIYASDIWILYKYLCDCNLEEMLAVIRSMDSNGGDKVKSVIQEFKTQDVYGDKLKEMQAVIKSLHVEESKQ